MVLPSLSPEFGSFFLCQFPHRWSTENCPFAPAFANPDFYSFCDHRTLKLEPLQSSETLNFAESPCHKPPKTCAIAF